MEASGAPETIATSEAVETELKGLPVLADGPTSDELHQDRDERPAVELAERNAQLFEPAAEPEKVEKAAVYAALAKEHDKPWWKRLVGWIRTRRGRAAGSGSWKGCEGEHDAASRKGRRDTAGWQLKFVL